MSKIRLIKPSLEIKLFKKAIVNTRKKTKTSYYNDLYDALEQGSKNITFSAIPIETFKANKFNSLNPESSEDFVKKISEGKEEALGLDAKLDGLATYLFSFHTENVRVPATLTYVQDGHKTKTYLASIAITDCGNGRYLISYEHESKAPIGRIGVVPVFYSFEQGQWYVSDRVMSDSSLRSELEVATLGMSLMSFVYNYDTEKEENESMQNFIIRKLNGLIENNENFVQEASEQLDDVLSILNGGI